MNMVASVISLWVYAHQEELKSFSHESGLRHTLNEKAIHLLIRFRIRTAIRNVIVCVTHGKALVGWTRPHIHGWTFQP